MPLRMEFFDDPLLRLTPPSQLNDPFDAKPSNAAIQKKSSFFCDIEWEEDNKAEIDEHYKTSLESGLEDFGVISLTEDPYNLLMWSHYADEHKGIVLRINANESTFEYRSDYLLKCGISRFTPERVIYSNRRPGIEMPESAIYDYFEDSFFSHIAMTKGDSWIYEKEHRYLLRLNQADVVICNSNMQELEGINKSGKIHITQLNAGKVKIEPIASFKDSFVFWLAMAEGNGIVKNVMYFKRLNASSITGIYLGCKINNQSVAHIIDRMNKSEKFNHGIPIFKSKTNPDRFEIDFIIMNTD